MNNESNIMFSIIVWPSVNFKRMKNKMMRGTALYSGKPARIWCRTVTDCWVRSLDLQNLDYRVPFQGMELPFTQCQAFFDKDKNAFYEQLQLQTTKPGCLWKSEEGSMDVNTMRCNSVIVKKYYNISLAYGVPKGIRPLRQAGEKKLL